MAVAQVDDQQCVGTSQQPLTIELSFVEPSHRHFLASLMPQLVVTLGDQDKVVIEPSQIEIGSSAENSVLGFCLNGSVREAVLNIGPDQYDLNVDWQGASVEQSLRDYQEVSEFDFAIATDFVMSQTDEGQLAIAFSLINPSKARFGANMDVEIGFRASGSCAGPSPFTQTYYIDFTIEKEVRVFREVDDFRISQPASVEYFDLRNTSGTYEGDYCGRRYAALRASLGRLQINPEEDVSTYYMIFSDTLLSPMRQKRIYFSSVSLKFTNAEIFPNQLGRNLSPF